MLFFFLSKIYAAYGDNCPCSITTEIIQRLNAVTEELDTVKQSMASTQKELKNMKVLLKQSIKN